MKKKIYYLLTFGLLFSACNKTLLNNNETSASAPQKALSTYTLENLHKTYNSMEEACASLEVLPAQERIRFIEDKTEFVHDFVWAFEMVIDNEKGAYEVQNLHPLYVSLSGERMKDDLPYLYGWSGRTARQSGIRIAEEEPLYMRGLHNLGVELDEERDVPMMFEAAAIAAAVAKNQPTDYNKDYKQEYEVWCTGGKMSGKRIQTSNRNRVERFERRCRKKGGCSYKRCVLRTYLVPVDVVKRFKITDEDIARFIQALEDTNINRAETENDYRTEEQGLPKLPAFEATRRSIWRLDAHYIHKNPTDIAQAVEIVK